MIPDRLRALLRQVTGALPASEEETLRPERPLVQVPQPDASREKPPANFVRTSPAFQQFVRSLDSSRDVRLLDLGGANSTNLQFMSQLGSRLYAEDFFATLEDCFGDGDFYENQRDPSRVESFLVQTFSEQRGPFDGALVWDSLQFLRPSLLERTVDHLYRLLEPGAYLLAYFYNDPQATSIPQYSFRIQDESSLHLTLRGEIPPGQPFSNRAIERTFEDFQGTKFYLSRDKIREVLVRR
ncbi:MAG: hypothetical protein NW208_12235 [Bryobacter sp.]|nr:hypothetical protein [Bryobacter sp.]